jgi:hypothetical protein
MGNVLKIMPPAAFVIAVNPDGNAAYMPELVKLTSLFYVCYKVLLPCA